MINLTSQHNFFRLPLLLCIMVMALGFVTPAAYAGCNSKEGTALEVSISGPENGSPLLIGETATYKCVVTANGKPYVGAGTYLWSTASTKITGVNGETTESITVTAGQLCSENKKTETISAQFFPEGGKAEDCKASAELVVAKLDITGFGATEEGLDSAEFKATVTPASVTIGGCAWSWEAPAGAENAPSVDFSAASATSTIVKRAHWFAILTNPNNDPNPEIRLEKYAPRTCFYKITGKVTLKVKEYKKTMDWSVAVPKERGNTPPPLVTGMPTIGERDVNGKKEWFVKDMGTLVRPIPVATISIPKTSQFYDKCVAHENRHVEQLKSIEPFCLLFNVQSCYTFLTDLTSAISKEDLEKQINDSLVFFNDKQLEVFSSDKYIRDADRNAHDISNQTAPHYLEQ